MKRSYIPAGLTGSLNDDQRYAAKVSVQEFQNSHGWYSLQQKLETLRDSKMLDLIGAARRDHLELAEIAGMVRAIDEFYVMFDKIIKEGDKD